MDLTANIAENRHKLIAIVATLFAMLGIGRVSQDVRLQILRTLRPAEAAVRRLIVMAAKGVVLKPAVPRPMPPGLSQDLRLKRRARGVRPVFQLSDPQVRMVAPVPKRYVRTGPRIWFIPPDDPTVTAIFAAQAPKAATASEPLETEDGDLPLKRRLEAIKLALDDLPRQARRLVRWRARRQAIAAKRPISCSTLRPGRAPYLPRDPVLDVDFVLERCHLLARDALIADTS